MNARTRVLLFWSLLGVGALALLGALAAVFLDPAGAPAILQIAFVILTAVLVGEILLLVLGRSKRFDEEGEWRDWQERTESARRELLLRCTTCGNTFPVEDTGERPLRHACPHCGRVGVLKEPGPTAGP